MEKVKEELDEYIQRRDKLKHEVWIMEENIKQIVSTNRIIKEPRVVVQTTSDVNILDEGYQWSLM